MNTEEEFIGLCLKLAQKGFPHTAPNPLVGAVIVKDSRIIAEGYHERCGSAHAEINAFRSAKEDLKDSTLYVNLEPCSHFGKTPPCVDAIIKAGIKEVFVGTVDPNPKVSGQGIDALQKAKIKVTVGILEVECRELNKRFFTFHLKKRPFIILKWAETADGFIAKADGSSKWISSEASRKLVHQWRAEEQAILVGTNTALIDNPQLTVRDAEGKDPLRITFDRQNILPAAHKLFDNNASTLILSPTKNMTSGSSEWIKIDFKDSILELLDVLYSKNIQSLMVEGGASLLSSFIERNLWDEARVFVSTERFAGGLAAPKDFLVKNSKSVTETQNVEGDTLYFLRNYPLINVLGSSC
jgi:diaminohydroxyphosphoribosylaminopyrimidine deaminase/5-amino-6-(5-phosphoribosylamino)uracil reductase